MGEVVSTETGEPVGDVAVRLEGTGVGSFSGARGRFQITGVPPGNHAIVTERIGFTTVRRPVTVASGDTVRVVLELTPAPVVTPGLVVTATRTAARAEDVAASLSVLSKDEVRSNPARTSDDLLREVTSVDPPRSSSTVSHPTAQSVSIRGTGRNRTLVLLDGIPLNDGFGGWVRWGRAPKQLVDRVEVIRGGSSSLFGTYAMGGVIQLLTRRPTKTNLSVTGSLGGRELRSISAFGTYVPGDWAFSASADVESGGGFIEVAPEVRGPVDENKKTARRNFTLHASYDPSADRRFFFTASVMDEDRQNGTPLVTNSRTIGTFGAGTELGRLDSGLLKANLFGSFQTFDNRNSQTFEGRSRETLILEQAVPVQDVGGSVLWSRKLGPFDLVSFGADARLIDGQNEEKRFSPGGEVTADFVSGGKQVLSGAFAQAVLSPWPSWRFEGSIRLDAWSNFDASKEFSTGGESVDFASRTDVELSPRIGVRFRASDQVTIRGAAYRSFRAPTLNELYRGFFTSNLSFDPNSELGPEILVGAELGIDWQPVPRVRIQTTGFWNQIEDRIDFVFKGFSEGVGRLQRENTGESRLRGFEAEVSVRPIDRLRVSANYTFIDSRILGTGNEIPDVNQDQAMVRASYEHPLLGRIAFVARYSGEEFEDDENEVLLPDFLVFDLDARRRIGPGLEAFISVENLFDDRIVTSDRGGITLLGLPRTVRAGFSASGRSLARLFASF